jgi:hypothetical protein
MVFLWETVPQRGMISGTVIAIQAFGDFSGFPPHCHVLCMEDVIMARGFLDWGLALTLKLAPVSDLIMED